MNASLKLNKRNFTEFFLDDFVFGLSAPVKTSDENLLGFIFILLTCLCFVVNALCIAHIIQQAKFKSNSKYSLLLHYFSFKLVFCVVLCITLLMSSVFKHSSMYITPTTWLCKCEFFLSNFIDTAENYLILFIWLVLLSDRNLIGFTYLNEPPSNVTQDTNAIRDWCQQNSRFITLVIILILIIRPSNVLCQIVYIFKGIFLHNKWFIRSVVFVGCDQNKCEWLVAGHVCHHKHGIDADLHDHKLSAHILVHAVWHAVLAVVWR